MTLFTTPAPILPGGCPFVLCHADDEEMGTNSCRVLELWK
jgi:hypothetical protein